MTAALMPSCGEEEQHTVRGTVCPTNGMTSLTPRRPRRVSLRKNSVQIGSAAEVPTSIPKTSRRPSVLTPTAMMAATETIRPPRLKRFAGNLNQIACKPRPGRRFSMLRFAFDLANQIKSKTL